MTVQPVSRLSPEIGAARDRAAQAAADMVENGMIVGLGTGDTTARFIDRLARRVRSEGLAIECVVTSEAAASRAREHGLPVRPLSDVARVDLAADGADEVNPRLDLIKGAGGAMKREKIVASAATTFVVIVDEGKLVDMLGRSHPVPLEVVPEAVSLVAQRLAALGARAAPRPAATAEGPWITDLGNRILDAHFPRIADPVSLNAALNDIPGVVEHGLFVGLATLALVGSIDATTVRRLAAAARP